MNAVNTPKQARPLFWFYLLVVYVFLQFSWWGYLMFSSNAELHKLKNEINLLKGESAAEIIEKGNELNKKLHQRWLMIAGEGIVFLAVLFIGVIQVRETFHKEIILTKQQKNFLLSVTHELKSPIASAKLQLQTLLKRDLNKEKQQEIIAGTLQDTERLQALVENILFATNIDNKTHAIYKEQQNISELIVKVAQQAAAALHFNQQYLHFNIKPDVWLGIDKNNFPSIIVNLIDNAVKYAGKEKPIKINLKDTGEHIVFTVADEGTGIDDEEKKHVFKKFYRVGSEDVRKTKGTGLGLYIVDYLVGQHGGTIHVKNNKPRGSIFEVVFNKLS